MPIGFGGELTQRHRGTELGEAQKGKKGRERGALDIQTGGVLEGQLPPKALALVSEWLALHREELMSIWTAQAFKAVEPLA